MSGFTTVTILGNLTRDPESKQTRTNKTVVSFSVAVNRKSGGEEYASFYGVQAWGKLAETVARYCVKGKQVLVSGRLHQERWEDQDGKKRERTKIVANDVVFMGPPDAGRREPPRGAPPSDGGHSGYNQPTGHNRGSPPPQDYVYDGPGPEDIPF